MSKVVITYNGKKDVYVDGLLAADEDIDDCELALQKTIQCNIPQTHIQQINKTILDAEEKRINKITKNADSESEYEVSQIENAIFDVKKAKFYLPHYKKDCISSIMAKSNNYWDNWLNGALPKIDEFLPENAVICDIGANIGSHTVYWALERNASKIYSFEPLQDTFDILKKNIELNNLENIVDIFNFGLTDEECKGEVANFSENNIGGTSFRKSQEGSIVFKTLDQLKIPEKIDLIKIDVEGEECRVLEGAKKTIIKNKPIIVIETFKYKKQVDAFMNSISYELAVTIRKGEDYIYKYVKKDSKSKKNKK